MLRNIVRIGRAPKSHQVQFSAVHKPLLHTAALTRCHAVYLAPKLLSAVPSSPKVSDHTASAPC